MVLVVRADIWSEQFPEETPFGLQGHIAESTWGSTVLELNHLIKTKIPSWKTLLFWHIIGTITGMIGGIVLGLVISLMHYIWLGILVFIILNLPNCIVPFKLFQMAKGSKVLQEYIKGQNESFYNANGVNLTLNWATIEIELRQVNQELYSYADGYGVVSSQPDYGQPTKTIF
eukprot:TRINITY_DN13270_c0_g1_i1.p1 TRINITY_DN13270_c0_g1~~TRINITY_DN13270_c0_g1_i1.p1  ORF type:complete len:182 (-),score=22.01 TRINITY_DN13270_c0_g1_i1:37-555(-)